MNTLSWLIYAAEVVGNIRGVIIAAAFIIGVLVGIAALVKGMNTDFGDGEPGDWLKPLRNLWLVAVLAVAAAAIPSTRTVYLIAASEAGEVVVTSPDAIEMMGNLQAIIKKRLRDELGGTDE